MVLFGPATCAAFFVLGYPQKTRLARIFFPKTAGFTPGPWSTRRPWVLDPSLDLGTGSFFMGDPQMCPCFYAPFGCVAICFMAGVTHWSLLPRGPWVPLF